VSAEAAIFATAAQAHARAESAAWAQFSAAREPSEFHASWLGILCTQIQRVDGALLVLGGQAGAGYTAAAVWPQATRDMRHLAPVAERTLKERRGLVAGRDGSGPPPGGQGACVGYPIEVDGVLHGAVVLELLPLPAEQLQRALRLLHWASAWLVDRVRQGVLGEQAARLQRAVLAQELLATSLQERRLQPSALSLVNELSNRLDCQRVSVGLEKVGSIALQAISHTATFDRRTDLARGISDAMDEVLDLGQAVVHPPPPGGDPLDSAVAAAHAELAARARSTAICSVPMVAEGAVVGVLTLERQDGPAFDAGVIELCTTLGLLLGPVFALKRENERGPWGRGVARLHEARRALLGPGHPGAKLGATAGVLLVLLLLFVDVPHRVAAKAVIEGELRRAAVAPFDGYIEAALVRAGDTVREGQLLARLLDRDLKLEQARWGAERELAQRRLRQASATQDRAAMAMAAAQTEQAQAQLSLVEQKLARTALTAPFDGVVVAGDLTPLLGSPVEQGKVLFELAPLERWRVLLEVDERDIGWLQAGQRGELAVAGIPHQTMPFSVRQVTPIASAQDGRNFFRVEAQIDGPAPLLRPGMEGIGKVGVGERSLLWLWTHGFTDWLRLALWRWWP
jgi:multidrug resistance efflux pump